MSTAMPTPRLCPGGKLSPVHATMWLLARYLQEKVEDIVPGLRPVQVVTRKASSASTNGTVAAAAAAGSTDEPQTVRLIHPKRRAAQLLAGGRGVSAQGADGPASDGGCLPRPRQYT